MFEIKTSFRTGFQDADSGFPGLRWQHRIWNFPLKNFVSLSVAESAWFRPHCAVVSGYVPSTEYVLLNEVTDFCVFGASTAKFFSWPQRCNRLSYDMKKTDELLRILNFLNWCADLFLDTLNFVWGKIFTFRLNLSRPWRSNSVPKKQYIPPNLKSSSFVGVVGHFYFFRRANPCHNLNCCRTYFLFEVNQAQFPSVWVPTVVLFKSICSWTFQGNKVY